MSSRGFEPHLILTFNFMLSCIATPWYMNLGAYQPTFGGIHERLAQRIPQNLFTQQMSSSQLTVSRQRLNPYRLRPKSGKLDKKQC